MFNQNSSHPRKHSEADKFTSYMCMPLSRKITEIILVIKHCYDCTWLQVLVLTSDCNAMFFEVEPIGLMNSWYGCYWNPWKITGFISISVTSQNQSNPPIISLHALFFLSDRTKKKCTHQCNVYFSFKRFLSIFLFCDFHAKSNCVRIRDVVMYGLSVIGKWMDEWTNELYIFHLVNFFLFELW